MDFPTLIKTYPGEVFALISAAVSTTVAVTSYFWSRIVERLKADVEARKAHIQAADNKIASLREECESKLSEQLANIKPILTPESNFDLKQFLPVNSVKSMERRRYFHEDKFWALDDANVWNYKFITGLEVYDEWFGTNLDINPILGPLKEDSLPLLLGKMHYWHESNKLTVNNHGIVKCLYSFISVQRRIIEDDADAPTKTLFHFLNWLDAFDRADDNISFRIESMSSDSNILYLKGYFTFRNIEIDNKIEPIYYLMREFIAIRAVPNLYIITTGVPNKDRAADAKYFSNLNEWLINFQLST